MRILHSLATVTILALAASAAGAAPHAAQPGQATIIQENASLMGAPGMAYLQLSSSEPRVQTVVASGAPEEVHRRIRATLKSAFPETFGESAV